MVKLKTLRFSISINKPQIDVFNYITSWEKQSEWILFTSINNDPKSTNLVRTSITAKTSLGPFGFVDTMEIVDWRPPYLCIVKHTGNIVLGEGIFRVIKLSENKSEFIWEERTPIPYGKIGIVGFVVVKPFLNVFFGISLKKLRKNIETIK